VLSGGPDVDPRAYGEEDQGACWGVDPTADSSEFALAREAVRTGLPTLAICRGLQVLNVALGGSLHQDISGADGHPPLEGPPEGLRAARHEIHLEPGSRLASLYGVERHVVNTIHHQAVKRVGAGLRVTARDENGIVEGLELDDGRPVFGVQWHPEKHEGGDRLFDELIAQARGGHRAGSDARVAA
jgi:putative glutamine amidotransferase